MLSGAKHLNLPNAYAVEMLRSAQHDSLRDVVKILVDGPGLVKTRARRYNDSTLFSHNIIAQTEQNCNISGKIPLPQVDESPIAEWCYYYWQLWRSPYSISR
jgi:hypothetical protein